MQPSSPPRRQVETRRGPSAFQLAPARRAPEPAPPAGLDEAAGGGGGQTGGSCLRTEAEEDAAGGEEPPAGADRHRGEEVAIPLGRVAPERVATGIEGDHLRAGGE